MNHRTLCAVVVLAAGTLAGCKCNAPSLGPLDEPKPASLGNGLVVDQPTDGLALDAAWVSVTGWVDRAKYNMVTVVGAPVDGYYLPTGHVGLPTVAVALREDGRFVAPRVPLQIGDTKVLVIPFSAEGVAGAQVELHVTARGVPTPATITVDPPEGGEAPLDVKFSAHAGVKVDNWQWDYDGDGKLDEEKPEGSHRYDTPGPRLVMARTRIDGLWVWAVAPVQVNEKGNVTHQSTQVTAPRAITVVPFYQPVGFSLDGDTAAGRDALSLTHYVLVADGDEVKVFDGQLNLLRTLTGLKRPSGMAGDLDGGVFVADTGNDRIVHFLADGTLDTGFADGGVLSTPDGGALANPTQLFAETHANGTTQLQHVTLSGLAHGRRFKCNKDLDCWESAQPEKPVERLVPGISWYGSLNDSWLLRGGTLLKDVMNTGNLVAVSKDGVLDAARDFGDSDPWWVALYPEGRLVESYQKLSNSRDVRLGFPATAIAVDEGSGYIIDKRTFGQRLGQRVGSPHVIYVAGPGRIERRELSIMTEGFW